MENKLDLEQFEGHVKGRWVIGPPQNADDDMYPYWEKLNYDDESIFSESGRVVANVDPDGQCLKDEELSATLSLIAAAPDLLAYAKQRDAELKEARKEIEELKKDCSEFLEDSKDFGQLSNKEKRERNWL